MRLGHYFIIGSVLFWMALCNLRKGCDAHVLCSQMIRLLSGLISRGCFVPGGKKNFINVALLGTLLPLLRAPVLKYLLSFPGLQHLETFFHCIDENCWTAFLSVIVQDQMILTDNAPSLACQRLWHTEAHITSSVQLFWCCTAHSSTWKKSSWMFCLIIFRHQFSFLVLINMSVSPMAVMMKLIGKSEFIHSPFLLTLSANHFNVWLCAHHVRLSASVTCRLWVRVDCKCVCMSACTFHKCILQDVYACWNPPSPGLHS